MGGNVFPDVSRRYKRDEYLVVETNLKNTLFPILFEKFEVCPYLSSKETFGDMDVIGILRHPIDSSFLKAMFNTPWVKHNGDCWSLIYDELQIDLIVSNHEEYEFHRRYLGRFDRGNFVGKVAHSLGLKFGHNGLWLPVRYSDSHKLGDILLTRDVRVAEDFLDIKPLENALTMEDVFKNIAASKFFRPENFMLENNNNIARTRDRKRPSYHAMLDWIQRNCVVPEYVREDKTKYLPYIFEHFPDARVMYDDMMIRKEEHDRYVSKLNGNIVSELTGLKDKALGEYMKWLKDTLSIDAVLEMSQENLISFIQENVLESKLKGELL